MAVKKIDKTKKTSETVKKNKKTRQKAGKIIGIPKEIKKTASNNSHSDVNGGEIIKEKAVREVKKESAEKTTKKNNEKYFYALGRRKAAVAQIRLFENNKSTENEIIINGKIFSDYFPVSSLQANLLTPLKAVGMEDKVRIMAIVRGGGFNGQVEAVRLGIARALVKYDDKLKKTLKDLKLLTRDSRRVERKKAGLKKARKSPQWAKR